MVKVKVKRPLKRPAGPASKTPVSITGRPSAARAGTWDVDPVPIADCLWDGLKRQGDAAITPSLVNKGVYKAPAVLAGPIL